MTASAEDVARVAQAMAAGVNAEARHLADALAQHGISGSTEAVEAAATPDDVSISWPASPGHAAGPSPQPPDGQPNPVAVVETSTPHEG
jgi:hypothetical protein